MTRIIILKNTVANKKLVYVGDVIDVDPNDAKFLVYIKKAKYETPGEVPATEKLSVIQPIIKTEMKQTITALDEPVKRKRGRPAKQ